MSKSSWSNTLWLEQPSYPWGNSDQLGTSACSIAWLNHGIADPCALFGNDTNRVLTSVYLPAHLLYSSRSQSAFLSPLHSLLHPGSKSPQTFSRTTHTKSSRYKWTPTPMPNMLTLLTARVPLMTLEELRRTNVAWISWASSSKRNDTSKLPPWPCSPAPSSRQAM